MELKKKKFFLPWRTSWNEFCRIMSRDCCNNLTATNRDTYLSQPFCSIDILPVSALSRLNCTVNAIDTAVILPSRDDSRDKLTFRPIARFRCSRWPAYIYTNTVVHGVISGVIKVLAERASEGAWEDDCTAKCACKRASRFLSQPETQRGTASCRNVVVGKGRRLINRGNTGTLKARRQDYTVERTRRRLSPN